MRALRVAPETVQLALPDPALAEPSDRWQAMPERTRAQVLALLAALNARGVLVDPVTAPVGEEVDGE